MKRTLVIVLAFILALTMSAVVLAEGLSGDEAEAVAETTEIAAETPDAEATEEANDEAVEAEEEAVEETTEEAISAPAGDEAEEFPVTESTPLYPHQENIARDDWMAKRDPAFSEEYWLYLYCLDHFHSTMWPDQEDDRYTLVIENRGDADGTITLFTHYGYDSWYETGELEGREFASYGAEVVTISLPAGEKTAYTFDPGYWYNSMGYAIIGASYEDISYVNTEALKEGPVVNNLTLEEYLAQCTHSELVIK